MLWGQGLIRLPLASSCWIRKGGISATPSRSMAAWASIENSSSRMPVMARGVVTPAAANHCRQA